jgi:ABC-2 type transport system ATP-binding protein
VILDEPTSGVDVSTRIALLELVRSLASGGVTVLYSTNVLSEVDALDPSVAILDEGRVVARGARRDVIGAHAASLLEFTFDGPPPAIDLANAQTSGSVVRVASAEPERLIVAVLERLGPQAARLRGVEVVKPSLESAFLALTGRRYDAEQQDAEIDVPPA